MKKIVTPHSDENPELGGPKDKVPSLLAADDDIDPSLTDQLYRSAKHKPQQGWTDKWD